jgi:hypothetical protein
MPAKSRLVRVFISSTFRDFIQERDELVKKVFPELRRRCKERFVELVEVDLRWGITAQQAESGQVLPICLSEIDKCRPFFIGLLGERYGWVPREHEYDETLVHAQPWLDEHRGGKSVTELEILHGVLNNPKMAGRALFYFRDRSWSESLGSDGMPEADGLAEKRLRDLKDRIRRSGFPVVEDYESPARVADRILDDLWALVDREFPLSEVPSGDDFIDWAHEDFAKSRLVAHVLRPDVLSAFDQALRQSNVAIVVGQAGSGKSSLLADWLQSRCSGQRSNAWYHSVGSAPGSAEPQAILRRLLKWLIGLGYCDPSVIADERTYTRHVSAGLAAADEAGTSLTLVIDALDQLTERSIDWLPATFPSSTRVLISSQPGVYDGEFSDRGWRQVSIPLLNAAEMKEVTRSYLARFRKSLSADDEQKILSSRGVSNPLFLRVLLDELRQVGTHENLAEQVQIYAADGELEALFGKVLDRLETDFGKELVSGLFGLLWASRWGLSESELQRLLRRDANEQILPRAYMAPLLGAVDDFLTPKTGRLSVFHATLMKVLAARYGEHDALTLHTRLAALFGEMAEDHPRRLSEEVFHLQQCALLGCEASAANLCVKLFDYGYSFDKIAAGYLEDCVSDFERAAAFDRNVYSEWARFLRYRVSQLRQPQPTTSEELHLQMALEDGEDSEVTHTAREWIRTGARHYAAAAARPSLFANPDPYEALYRHPLCPAPKDLRGHGSWITGWLILQSGDAVSYSRDPFIVAWSLSSERPLRRINGFAQGTLGAIEDAVGRIWFWGFAGKAKVWNPATDAVADLTLPATLEAAVAAPSGDLVLWDIEGRIFGCNAEESTPRMLFECGDPVISVDFDGPQLIVKTTKGSFLADADSGTLNPAGDFLIKQSSSHAGLGASTKLSEALAAARTLRSGSAAGMLIDWPRDSVAMLVASSGRNIPWHSRSTARDVWSCPKADLHLVATLSMLLPIRTFEHPKGAYGKAQS